MHEISLAQQIDRIASSRAKSLGYARAKVVRVRLGAWSCANPDLLKRAFQALPQAQDAILEVEVVEPECICGDCGSRFSPKSFRMTCESCGSRKVTLKQGRELDLYSIEV